MKSLFLFLSILCTTFSTPAQMKQKLPTAIDTSKTIKNEQLNDTLMSTPLNIKPKIDSYDSQSNSYNNYLTIYLAALAAILTTLTIILVFAGYISYKAHKRELKKIKKVNDNLKWKIEKDLTEIIDNFKKESKGKMVEVDESVQFYKNLQDSNSPTLRNLIKQHTRGQLMLDNIDWLYYHEGDFDEALNEISKLESEDALKSDKDVYFLCKIKKAKILNDQKNKNKDLDTALVLFKELLLEQPKDRDLLDIFEQLGACYYQKGSTSTDNRKDENLNNYLYAKEYFSQILPPLANNTLWYKARLFIGICDLNLLRFIEARDNFIQACDFFIDKDKILFELSRLGKYSCFNELGDDSCKIILHQFFNNEAAYKESISFWSENFPELNYFIERLKVSHNELHADNIKK